MVNRFSAITILYTVNCIAVTSLINIHPHDLDSCFCVVGEYCSEPGEVRDGFYMCKPNTCELFKVGTEVDYICSKDHEPRPDDVMAQTCLPGGHWSAKKPVCAPGNQNRRERAINIIFTNLTIYVLNIRDKQHI